MRFCSVILFYFSFNYIFFNGNTRYLLVEIDAAKEKQEVLVPENIGITKSVYSKCWGNLPIYNDSSSNNDNDDINSC